MDTTDKAGEQESRRARTRQEEVKGGGGERGGGGGGGRGAMMRFLMVQSMGVWLVYGCWILGKNLAWGRKGGAVSYLIRYRGFRLQRGAREEEEEECLVTCLYTFQLKRLCNCGIVTCSTDKV
jgi:hypothetical protein